MADAAQAERMIGWMQGAGFAGSVATIVTSLALSYLLVRAGAWLLRRAGIMIDGHG